VRWNVNQFQVTPFTLDTGSAIPGQWKHVTFSTAGVIEIPPIETAIGGKILPIDTTALPLAGIQTNFSILTAFVMVGAGAFGALYYTAKRKN